MTGRERPCYNRNGVVVPVAIDLDEGDATLRSCPRPNRADSSRPDAGRSNPKSSRRFGVLFRTWTSLRRHLVAAAVSLLLTEALTSAAEPPADANSDSAPGARADALPINIFVNSRAELGGLWKSLLQPDFVILRGEEYSRLLGARDVIGARPPWAAIVESVRVSGSVSTDLAPLTVEMAISVVAEGPTWAVIGLDGQTLESAMEGERYLPLRATDSGTWLVELTGRGRHHVRINLLAPVHQTPRGSGLELAIPEAAATRFALDLSGRVLVAELEPGEPVAVAWDEKTKVTRIAGSLTPRSRLGLSWRHANEPAAPSPPLLSALGEIALEVDSGTLRARSAWSIRSLRGESNVLELELDAEDEVTELELDGTPHPVADGSVRKGTRLTIPLAEPLRPTGEKRLLVSTRRSIPAGPSPVVEFRGFPIANALDQAGAIGVSQGANLFIVGDLVRGVRRIDPRTELPADLRARPATVLAYRFTEQPFALRLRVEPSPALARTEARTTVELDSRIARQETALEVQAIRGRLFELCFGLSKGLEIESVGPEELVAAWMVEAPAGSADEPDGTRRLTVRLAARARDAAKFTIHLAGRQAIDPSTTVSLTFPQPRSVITGVGGVAVLTEPGSTAERVEGATGAGAFRPAALPVPADWPWPGGRAPPGGPMLWLQIDGGPGVLALRLRSHPRSWTHSSTLLAQVGRHEVEVRQDMDCALHFGTLDHLDVVVPRAIEATWESVGSGVARQVDLRKTPEGDRIVRLELQSGHEQSARLRFRFRVPLSPALAPDSPADVTVPWVRPHDSSNRPGRIEATISATRGLSVEETSRSWLESSREAVSDDDGTTLRLAGWESDARALALRVATPATVGLPRVVVPRLRLRTALGDDDELRTVASYWVESHDSSFSVALPPGATLERVRVGGEGVGQVEQIPGGYRLALPAAIGRSPTLVELEYTTPGTRSTAPWRAPRLLDEGIVQQSYWEVRIPWRRELLGVPQGWADENEWFWTGASWRRRPTKTPAQLAAWTTGPNARNAAPAGATLPLTDSEPLGDAHTYLFSRPGDPAELDLVVASRALLLTVCSGAVLLIGGLSILVWRPPARFVAIFAPALVLAVVAFVHPSVTWLVVQSGMLGILLTLLIAMMRRIMETRGFRSATSASHADFNGRAEAAAVGSSVHRGATAGSDDSTAIRVRPISTLDHLPANAPAPAVSSSSTPVAEGSSDRGAPVARAERGGPG